MSNLKDHQASSGHLKCLNFDNAIQSERVQCITKCMDKEFDKIESVVCRLIRMAYTVAKENMPISKFAALCELQISNNTMLMSSLYQDSFACSEFIAYISEFLDNSLLEKTWK